MMRPLGTPPMPRAMSRDSEPVGMASTMMWEFSPRRMMEPLPYSRSIWAMAVSSARFLSEAGAGASITRFFSAISDHPLSGQRPASIHSYPCWPDSSGCFPSGGRSPSTTRQLPPASWKAATD